MPTALVVSAVSNCCEMMGENRNSFTVKITSGVFFASHIFNFQCLSLLTIVRTAHWLILYLLALLI